MAAPNNPNEYAVVSSTQFDMPTIPATILYSKASKNILCLEAGKEFVDMVVGFLTLPMGCIVKLLQGMEPQKTEGAPVVGHKQEVKPLSSIMNLFESAEKLEDSRMCSAKSLLVDPRPTQTYGGKLITIQGTEGATPFFCCGAPQTCELLTKRTDLKCPKHKRNMQTLCKIIETDQLPEVPSATKKGKKSIFVVSAQHPGYVKGDQTYMITNSLEVFPSSTIKTIMRLTSSKSEKMSDLETLDIPVHSEEILQLLKYSIVSNNVLNDVFGKHCKKGLATTATTVSAAIA